VFEINRTAPPQRLIEKRLKTFEYLTDTEKDKATCPQKHTERANTANVSREEY